MRLLLAFVVTSLLPCLADGEDRVARLLRKLRVDDYIMRSATLNALFNYNDKRIYHAVKEVFRNTTEDDVRFWCACIMLKSGDEDAREFLLKGLRSENERHRYHALAAFGRAKDRSVIDELKDAFKHETVPQVQTVAAYALANLGFREGYDFLKRKVKDDDWLAQDMAAVLLGWLKTDDAKPLLQNLFGSIPADDKGRRAVKICAAWGLAHYGVQEAKRYLIEAGYDSLTAQVGICELGEQMIPILKEVLKETTSAAVRRNAATLLGILGGREVINSLTEALKKTTAAAVALAYTMHPDAVQPLAKVATNPKANRVLRRNAIKALGILRFDSCIEPLKKVLNGEAFKENEKDSRSSIRLRECAVFALGEIASEDAVKALCDSLKKEKPPALRKSICWVIKKQRLLSAVPTLIDLLEEGEEGVRGAALDALRSLTGRDYGTDADRWRELLKNWDGGG